MVLHVNAKKILDLIGNTPIVEVQRLNPNPAVKMYVKLEKNNPGGSIKDRVALYMIEQAEKSGQLTAGKTVIESTSGNTGIGIALVCRAKGYDTVIVMPETMSMERRQILIAFGAKVRMALKTWHAKSPLKTQTSTICLTNSQTKPTCWRIMKQLHLRFGETPTAKSPTS
jgi:cysteine synthase